MLELAVVQRVWIAIAEALDQLVLEIFIAIVARKRREYSRVSDSHRALTVK